LIESIRELFRQWISDIDLSGAKPKIAFDWNSKFLTFNYTETLQCVYEIPDTKVFHIHGSAKADDDLIFGHGESCNEEPEVDENGESNRTMFTDAEGAAKYPFYALQKRVLDVIDGSSEYFSSLHDIKNIVVIGHSLNKIDLPYFQEVAKKTPDCPWLVYCHEKSDCEHHRSQLIQCGVNALRIETCAYY
jgi:hypothetical protein